MKKSLISAAILASLGSLTLSGCFSSSSSGIDGEDTVTLKGVAVDGYLEGMACYADANSDGQFTAGADAWASDRTTNTGYYIISAQAPDGLYTGSRVCQSTATSRDVATGESFRGQLTAPAKTHLVGEEPSPVYLTPVTTFIASYGSVDAGEAAVKKVFPTLGDADLYGDPMGSIQLSQANVTINTITSSVTSLLARQANDTTDINALNAIYKNSMKGLASAVEAKLKDTPDALDFTDGSNSGVGQLLQTTIDNATSLVTGGDTTTNPDNNILTTAVTTSLTGIISAYADATDPETAQDEASKNAGDIEAAVSSATAIIEIADGVVDTTEVPDAVSGTSGSTSTAVSAVSGGTL